ncbi:hypothetical protein [Modestobacter versicolor]|uniref:Uncharacterized protein n=1 Tax=Modestobacter versicolor TaxID=429133 RepID=A0A839Y3E3_9ACTN|nr:hypothetical protein [Modestobacter versicolor]MBB3676957.1 hypothetical protein [Modestobacter versicolor]
MSWWAWLAVCWVVLATLTALLLGRAARVVKRMERGAASTDDDADDGHRQDGSQTG